MNAVPLYELPPPDLMDHDMSYMIANANISGMEQTQGGQTLEQCQAKEECCLNEGIERRQRLLHGHVSLNEHFV